MKDNDRGILKRVFAHLIRYENSDYRMSVVTVYADGDVKISPFDREIHSTIFVSGIVEVKCGSDGKIRLFRESGQEI